MALKVKAKRSKKGGKSNGKSCRQKKTRSAPRTPEEAVGLPSTDDQGTSKTAEAEQQITRLSEKGGVVGKPHQQNQDKVTAPEPQVEEKIEEWLTCARVDCGAKFKVDPEMTTQHYCSKRCVLIGGTRRLGLRDTYKALLAGERASKEVKEAKSARMRAVNEKLSPEERQAKMAAIRAKRQEMTGQGDAELTLKWGPLRDIVEVLKDQGKSKRVRLSCKHEKTVAASAKQGRCGACSTKPKRSEKSRKGWK